MPVSSITGRARSSIEPTRGLCGRWIKEPPPSCWEGRGLAVSLMGPPGAGLGGVTKATVLILTDHYLPGYRSGGPVQSIRNMSRALSDEFAFRVLTRDRDLGETQTYPHVIHGRWQSIEGTKVRYLSRSESMFGLAWILRSTQYDVLYLNSLFAPWYSIVPLLLRRVHLIPTDSVVVACRGQLAAEALAIRPVRKRLFLATARKLRLFQGTVWHATSEEEAKQIGTHIGRGVVTRIAGVIPSARLPSGIASKRTGKVVGEARVVYLSRITPMKNLLFAITVLGATRNNIIFDIFGPMEDPDYWSQCRDAIASLPANIRASYKGEVEHELVASIFGDYDLFLLPTLGENYGHVIMEALAAGCPVAVSDRTPWNNLSKEKVGWVLPLEDVERWARVVGTIAAAGDEQLDALAHQARAVAERLSADASAATATRHMFRAILTQG